MINQHHQKIITIILGVIYSIQLTAQSQCQLTVHVENIKEPGGVLRLGVYDSHENLFVRTYKWAALKTNPTIQTYSFELDSLAYGEYVVAVYNDVNNDNNLNLNVLGIPKEEYALSNIRYLLSYPSFKRAKIKLEHSEQEIFLKLNSFF